MIFGGVKKIVTKEEEEEEKKESISIGLDIKQKNITLCKPYDLSNFVVQSCLFFHYPYIDGYHITQD